MFTEDQANELKAQWEAAFSTDRIADLVYKILLDEHCYVRCSDGSLDNEATLSVAKKISERM